MEGPELAPLLQVPGPHPYLLTMPRFVPWALNLLASTHSLQQIQCCLDKMNLIYKQFKKSRLSPGKPSPQPKDPYRSNQGHCRLTPVWFSSPHKTLGSPRGWDKPGSGRVIKGQGKRPWEPTPTIPHACPWLQSSSIPK